MKLSATRIKELATLVRYYILRSTTAAGSGHPSSSLSATDLMTTLFFGGFFHAHLDNPNHPANDRLIFSKGHAAPLLYSLYAAAHQITEAELLTLRKFESSLEGHPTMRFPFTEAATGSLGQGLSVGMGMALGAKIDDLSYRTFVLLGDSEIAEGSIWETARLASHYKLNNLIGVLDLNGLGQRGVTMDGHDAKSVAERFEAFGWRVKVINGHDIKQVAKAYKAALFESSKPIMIIAKTVKGKGVRFIENKEGWHGRVLTEEECSLAIKGLGKIPRGLRGVVFKPPVEKPTNYIFNYDNKIIHHERGELFSTREAYGEALVSVFPKYKNMVVLDAEVSNSTYAGTFKKTYPERFFEMFIAEQNMVGTALGLSRRGKIPFVSTFAAFFVRAADQIRMSQYSNSNIKFVGSHSGISIGEDGASQMGLEDIAMFRSQLDSVVLYPADAVATHKLVAEAVSHFGNVYLRTTRAKVPTIYQSGESFPIGGCKVIREGARDVVTVVTAGITLFEALKAHEALMSEAITIRVIDLYSIKPLDVEMIKKAALETKAILTVEDHFEAGGIGEAVKTALAETGAVVYSLCVKKMPRSGSPEQLLAYAEIDADAIIKKVKQIIKKRVSGK